jgi:hypothetical protein
MHRMCHSFAHEQLRNCSTRAAIQLLQACNVRRLHAQHPIARPVPQKACDGNHRCDARVISVYH